MRKSHGVIKRLEEIKFRHNEMECRLDDIKYSDLLVLILSKKGIVFPCIYFRVCLLLVFFFFFFFLGGGGGLRHCVYSVRDIWCCGVIQILIPFHKILWRQIRWMCWFINSASKRLIRRIWGSLRALMLESDSTLDTSVKVRAEAPGRIWSYQQNNFNLKDIWNIG